MKIGIISSWTGSLAAYGPIGDPWIKVVDQEVKDQGGILGGRPVQFVKYDDGSITSGTAAGVTKLALDENVVAFGFAGTLNALQIGASDAAEKLHVLTVVPGTYDISNYKYTIRTNLSPAGNDDGAVNFVIKTLKPKNLVWLITAAQENQQVRIPRMNTMLTAAGIKVLETIVIPLDATDFSPYITRVKYLNPNVIMLIIETKPLTIAQQLPQLGGWPNSTVMGMTSGMTQINTTTYPAAIGWYSTASYVPGMINPAAQKMEADWARVNPGMAMNAPTAIWWINLWTAVKAIELAGTTDREAIAKAARSGNLAVDTPYGGQLKIQTDGTPIRTVPVAVVKFLEGGKFQQMPNP